MHDYSGIFEDHNPESGPVLTQLTLSVFLSWDQRIAAGQTSLRLICVFFDTSVRKAGMAPRERNEQIAWGWSASALHGRGCSVGLKGAAIHSPWHPLGPVCSLALCVAGLNADGDAPHCGGEATAGRSARIEESGYRVDLGQCDWKHVVALQSTIYRCQEGLGQQCFLVAFSVHVSPAWLDFWVEWG